jgi:hypothetical protein
MRTTEQELPRHFESAELQQKTIQSSVLLRRLKFINTEANFRFFVEKLMFFEIFEAF